jgi:DNA polymerase III delta subunit
MSDPYDLADIARRVYHAEAENALHWAAGEIARLRAKLDESARLWAAAVAQSEHSERDAAVLTKALERMRRMVDEAISGVSKPHLHQWQRVLVQADAALETDAGAQLLTLISAAVRYRDAVRADDIGHQCEAEQALLAAVEQIEGGQGDAL